MNCDICNRETKFMTIIDVTRLVEDFPAQGYKRQICHKCAHELDDYLGYFKDSSITQWENLD